MGPRVVTLREQWTLRFVRGSKSVVCGYSRREMVVKLTPDQIGFDDDIDNEGEERMVLQCPFGITSHRITTALNRGLRPSL